MRKQYISVGKRQHLHAKCYCFNISLQVSGCTDFELFIPSQICQNLNLPTKSEPAHLFWNRTESLDLCCYPRRGVFHPSDSCNVAKASASDNFPLCILSSLFYQRFFSTLVSAHLGAREIFSMPSKTCPPNLNLPTVDNGQR